MKKFVSLIGLLLAVAMCLCPLMGAVAEEGGAEGTEVGMDAYALALYESFMASTTLEEMYYDKLVPAHAERSDLLAMFTDEQIIAIGQLANTIYAAVEDPDAAVFYQGEDKCMTVADLYDELMASLATVFENYNVAVYASYVQDSGEASGDMTGSNFIAAAKDGKIALTGDVMLTLNGTLESTDFVNGKFVIDLQGHTLKRERKTVDGKDVPEGRLLTSNASDVELIIKDSVGGGAVIDCGLLYNDGGDDGGAFQMKNGTIRVQGGTFRNNNAQYGGAISAKNIYIEGGSFVQNYACSGLNKAKDMVGGYGGAIYASETVTVTGGTFDNNWVGETIEAGQTSINGHGGCIVAGQSINIENGTFTRNKALTEGGALYAPNITITGGTFGDTNTTLTWSDNTVKTYPNIHRPDDGMAEYVTEFTRPNGNEAKNGGAIYADTLTISGAVVAGNYASNNGGGIFCCNLTMSDTTLYGNECNTNGANIALEVINDQTGTATITNSQILGGFAHAYAGAVNVLHKGYLTITNTTIAGNGCAINGGAFTLHTDSTTNIGEGTIIEYNCAVGVDNSQHSGKGGAFRCVATLNITGGEIRYNRALREGGGIQGTTDSRVKDVDYRLCTVTLNGGKIHHNYAGTLGGGIFIDEQAHKVEKKVTFALSGTEVYENTAELSGGGIYLSASVNELEATLQGGSIKNNTAGGNGGGLCVELRKYVDDDGEESDEYEGKSGDVIISGNIDISGNSAGNNYNGGGVALINQTDEGTVSVQMVGGTVGTSAYPNVAMLGAGVYVDGGDFSMTDGTMAGNTATVNGGGVYVNSGNFTMSSGTLSGNSATADGGGVYVTGGKVVIGVQDCSDHVHPELINNSAVNGGAIAVAGSSTAPTMYCGTMTGNRATGNGGAVYVSGGGFEMVDGTIGGAEGSGNRAVNGGAVYASGGSFTMDAGSISYNTASNDGGAVYIHGGDFIMISGVLKNNEADNMGGGVYVTGGNITVGVVNCAGTGVSHTVDPTNKNHPQVQNNTAYIGGGFCVSDGIVMMHCGVIGGENNDNHADNDGLGNNIYISGGLFTIKKGSIGLEDNPGIVVVGGELHDNRYTTVQTNVVYHLNFGNEVKAETNLDVPIDGFINIPTPTAAMFNDQTKIPPDELYVFVGWSEGVKENLADDQIYYVKTTSDYHTAGKAVSLSPVDEETLHFYAIWALKENTITWNFNGGDDSGYNSLPTNYKYTQDASAQPISLPSPTRAGYIFNGWQLDQSPVSQPEELKDEYQRNWGQEEDGNVSEYYVVTDSSLPVINRFGHITLTAQWEAAFSSLTINVTDTGEHYLFTISGNRNDGVEFAAMQVTVPAGDSVTISELPVGTYTVNELTSWSWRYNPTSEGATATDSNVGSITVPVNDPDTPVTVTFTNSQTKYQWLDGNDYFPKD